MFDEGIKRKQEFAHHANDSNYNPTPLHQKPKANGLVNLRKEELVKQLPITKNSNLYTEKEVNNYKGYDDFKHNDEADKRRDHFMLLRTNDIEGAYVSKKHRAGVGLKTHNFFPDYPDMNKFYNHAKSSGCIKTLSEIADPDGKKQVWRKQAKKQMDLQIS